MLDRDGRRGFRRLVIGQRNPPGVVFRAPGFLETRARDHPLRHNSRDHGHGPADDRVGRAQVLFEQQRRNRQHVAVIVEPIAGVIRWELVGRVVVHAEQVADRVPILDPVEPADRDPAWIRVVRVDPERPRLIQSSSNRRSSADGCGLSAGGMIPDRTFLSTACHNCGAFRAAFASANPSSATPPSSHRGRGSHSSIAREAAGCFPNNGPAPGNRRPNLESPAYTK